MNTEKAPWQKIKKHLRLAMQGCAWPGCYPTYLIMSDYGVLCPECVRKEIKRIIQDYVQNNQQSGFYPYSSDVNYEDNSLFCDNCNAKIEAAYIEDK